MLRAGGLESDTDALFDAVAGGDDRFCTTPRSALPLRPFVAACWFDVRDTGDCGSLVEFPRRRPDCTAVLADEDAGLAMELFLAGAFKASLSFEGNRVWPGTSLRGMLLGGRIIDVGRGLGGGGMAALSSDRRPSSLPDASSLMGAAVAAAASLPSLENLRVKDCGRRLRRLDCFDDGAGCIVSSPCDGAPSAGLCLPAPICCSLLMFSVDTSNMDVGRSRSSAGRPGAGSLLVGGAMLLVLSLSSCGLSSMGR